MIIDKLRILLESWGLTPNWSLHTATVVALVLFAIIILIIDRVARRILVDTVVRVARRTRVTWDDKLVEHGVLQKLAHLIPTVVVCIALPMILAGWADWLVELIRNCALIYLVVAIVITINRALLAALAIYNGSHVANDIPLRPLVQVIQALVCFAAAVLLIALLLERSAATILGGLGAFTAVLLIVFQQPLLGLTAGIQLSSNRMIRIGDWITVPKFGADGTVTDLSLTTVSVQNWDKTISAVPTHALITDTFKNWRGMEESGGRRVKRSILIDMNTVRFMDAEMTQRLRSLQFLREYLDHREREINDYNQQNAVDESSPANGRRLTNLGSFRAYLEHYLRAHPQVSDTLTFLVRQLDPTPQGIPIEVYVFLTEQRWAQYESIQADLFDHILAVIPEFGLRVFQAPSGRDLQQVSSSLRSS